MDGLETRLFLPKTLRELGTAAKMLWVYFNLTDRVMVSQRDLSIALGLTQNAVSQNLTRLSEAGVINYNPSQSRSEKSEIKAVRPIFKPILESFPTSLREADASSKLLYLWLLPQEDVTHSPKEVAAYLGMTEMTATKARGELETLDILIYKQRPIPRQHGIYHVLAPRNLQAKVPDVLAIPEAISGKGAALKLYWYISHKGEVTSRQQLLAKLLDVPQSAISKAVQLLLEQDLIKKKGEDFLVSTEVASQPRRTPKDLKIPDKLVGETNAVQFLYLWLKPQGKVSYSYSELVELIRIRSNSLMLAVKRLEELGLLEVYKKPTPHRKGMIKVL
jgi:DNA-binding MarR family transcriptional regulator